MQELKYKQKIELKDKTRRKSKYELKLEEERKREEIREIERQKKAKKVIRNFSIFLIFVFGILCIAGYSYNKIAPIISFLQVCLLVITILTCEDILHLFVKDYKILFITSIILTIVWLASLNI